MINHKVFRLIAAVGLFCGLTSLSWAEIEIAHDPIESASSGERISMTAVVEDSEHDLETVRTYFKSSEDSQFYYVSMSSEDGENFASVLPAPSAGVGSIEYFILVKNSADDIIKSQNFTVEVDDSDGAAESSGTLQRIEYRDVDGYHGRVVRLEGDITVVAADGSKRSLQEAGFVVLESETIETGTNGMVAVDFDNDPVTVLDNNSRLKVRKPGFFTHIAGKAFFAFKKVFGVSSEPRFVENLTTTVGIRGTKFISYEGERQGYALKEGRLAFGESGSQTFQLETDGTTESKRFFDLEEGNEVFVDGDKLRQTQLSSQSVSDFERLEGFAAAILGGVILADAASSGRVAVSAEGQLPQQVNGFDGGDISISKSPAPIGASATTGTVAVAAAGGLGTAGIIGIGAGTLAVAGGASGSSRSDDDDDGGSGGDDGATQQCNDSTTSGGDDPETHIVDLGQTSGTFNVTFDAASVKDQMQVFYENRIVSDSGCIGDQIFTDTVTFSGSSSSVRVEITPNCEFPDQTGTFWLFTVECPI
ncbi:MAG: hypothetical protein AAF434_17695 [Pseudomonadota bacterium]